MFIVIHTADMTAGICQYKNKKPTRLIVRDEAGVMRNAVQCIFSVGDCLADKALPLLP